MAHSIATHQTVIGSVGLIVHMHARLDIGRQSLDVNHVQLGITVQVDWMSTLPAAQRQNAPLGPMVRLQVFPLHQGAFPVQMARSMMTTALVVLHV